MSCFHHFSRSGFKSEKHRAAVGSIKLYGDLKEPQVLTDAEGIPVSQVDFDFALTEAKKSNTNGGIGVNLGGIKLGTFGASHSENEPSSRIRFSVPIIFSASQS